MEDGDERRAWPDSNSTGNGNKPGETVTVTRQIAARQGSPEHQSYAR